MFKHAQVIQLPCTEIISILWVCNAKDTALVGLKERTNVHFNEKKHLLLFFFFILGTRREKFVTHALCDTLDELCRCCLFGLERSGRRGFSCLRCALVARPRAASPRLAAMKYSARTATVHQAPVKWHLARVRRLEESESEAGTEKKYRQKKNTTTTTVDAFIERGESAVGIRANLFSDRRRVESVRCAMPLQPQCFANVTAPCFALNAVLVARVMQQVETRWK